MMLGPFLWSSRDFGEKTSIFGEDLSLVFTQISGKKLFNIR